MRRYGVLDSQNFMGMVPAGQCTPTKMFMGLVVGLLLANVLCEGTDSPGLKAVRPRPNAKPARAGVAAVRCKSCRLSKCQDATVLDIERALTAICHCKFHQQHYDLLHSIEPGTCRESSAHREDWIQLATLRSASGRMLIESFNAPSPCFWVYLHQLVEMHLPIDPSAPTVDRAMLQSCKRLLRYTREMVLTYHADEIVCKALAEEHPAVAVKALLTLAGPTDAFKTTGLCKRIVAHAVKCTSCHKKLANADMALIIEAIMESTDRVYVGNFVLSMFITMVCHEYEKIDALPGAVTEFFVQHPRCVLYVISKLVTLTNVSEKLARRYFAFFCDRDLLDDADLYKSALAQFFTVHGSDALCGFRASIRARISPLLPAFLEATRFPAEHFDQFCEQIDEMCCASGRFLKDNRELMRAIVQTLDGEQRNSFRKNLADSSSGKHIDALFERN
ncbi:hypothetical protein PAPHI01_0930 [Pancytospora philotis]|nr:hypothetical protein PAPHI01_0930 [Pancytospora philotis]